MNKRTITIFLVMYTCTMNAQPNCNIFLMNKDTALYKACEYVTEHKNDYYEFDWRQIEIYEKAIEICPRLAYPIYEYGVPYLKAGNFIKWKYYMDKAVEIDPIAYLGIRGSLKCKFVADYEGAIADINELTTLMNGNDIGSTHDGAYHLNMIKGLSYKALGKIDDAITVMERQLLDKNHMAGFYDHLHLGVLYLEKGDYQTAIEHLIIQSEESDLAENRFYISKAYRGTNNKEAYDEQIKIAKDYIMNNRTMTDPYNELFDKVYLEDINEEINRKWR